MRKVFFVVLILIISNAYSQSAQKVFTSDIDNFWTAFDSIQQTKDYSKKLYFINKLYIEKGTKGLKAIMNAESYNDTLYLKVIDKFPDFWKSIRFNTLSLKNKTNELNASISSLKKLYPDLKDAEIYLTIGCLNAGGTTRDNMVLIGTELAAGDPTTGARDLKSLDNFVRLNIHEYVHTQQKLNYSYRLLNQVIKEGSADFIAELALNKQKQYFSNGTVNLDTLKEQFIKEMFLGNKANWLYNGNVKKKDSVDLGYFIGYEICKSYYHEVKNKKKAIKDIIELDYSNDKAVELFLTKSKFYKKKLIAKYEKKLPHIVKIGPFKNGANNVDSKINEFRITFSKEMIPGNYSIDSSEKGKEYSPIKKVIGFENHNKTFVASIELQSGKEYEFIITNRHFMSKDEYPLREKEYLVKFRTK